VGGKGELTATFQDLHAVSDSFDICKFSAFAEGIEEYVLQYNGMTGRDLSEDELFEAGERVYNLERYYNNLVGFDGADDTLPNRFVGGTRTPSRHGRQRGQLAELDEMKAEYYETRDWVDGVVPDEKLEALGIDIGPVPASPPATPQPRRRLRTVASRPPVAFFGPRAGSAGAARTDLRMSPNPAPRSRTVPAIAVVSVLLSRRSVIVAQSQSSALWSASQCRRLYLSYRTLAVLASIADGFAVRGSPASEETDEVDL